MYHCLIDENLEVQNIIVWDGDTVNNPYPVPQGWLIKQSDVAGIGWTYDKKTREFTKPVAVEAIEEVAPEPTVEERLAQLEAVVADLQK